MFDQLGLGDHAPQDANTAQKVGIGGVSSAAAGGDHSLAICFENNRSAWSWGSNAKGQLGLGEGSADRYNTPKRVLGPGADDFMNNAVQVSAGNRHSVALRDNGYVWSWGDNSYGQLGVEHAGALEHEPLKVFFPLSAVTLTANPDSPQVVGTAILFTAMAVGGKWAPIEEAWFTEITYSWTPSLAG